MKLRLRHNSIRLRLTQKEVAEFSETGSVEDRIDFGANISFRYRLESDHDADAINASFRDGCITVTIPEDEGITWAGSEQVGLESTQSDDVGGLSVLIEKDFACLEPRSGGEDDDTFPNPLKCGSRDTDILEHSAK